MKTKPTGTQKLEEIKDSSHYPAPLNVIAREWSAIKSSPFSFIVCIIVVGILIWWSLDRLYTAELRAKDATIQTLSLRPESVPVQAQEIERLRSEMKLLRENETRRLVTEWPPLSDEQSRNWVKELSPYKIEAITIYWSHGEGQQFYAGLVSTFKAMNCKVIPAGGSCDPGGFEIHVSPDDPAGPVLLKLFNDGGYKANLTFRAEKMAEIKARGESRISIFLGPKI